MKELLASFQKSLRRLEEILQANNSIITRDAAIKRFEFTIELAWKTLQKFLRSEEIVCQSPKQCFKEAFTFGLIEDDEKWIEMMADRNLTVHTYHEETAEAVFKRLPQYLPLLKKLTAILSEKVVKG